MSTHYGIIFNLNLFNFESKSQKTHGQFRSSTLATWTFMAMHNVKGKTCMLEQSIALILVENKSFNNRENEFVMDQATT